MRRCNDDKINIPPHAWHAYIMEAKVRLWQVTQDFGNSPFSIYPFFKMQNLFEIFEVRKDINYNDKYTDQCEREWKPLGK